MAQNKVKNMVLTANKLRFFQFLLSKISLKPDDNATFATCIYCCRVRNNHPNTAPCIVLIKQGLQRYKDVFC